MPLFKRLAGPRELSKAIGSYAKFVGSDPIFGDLPAIRERLEVLLELAYHTSMSPEEGRFPTLRLFVPSKAVAVNLNGRIEFQAVLPNSAAGVETLKRLAPAAGSTNQMLIVEDLSGEWVCTGLASIEPTYSPTMVGRREWHLLFPNRPAGIIVRIDGPGALRVDIGVVLFRLEAGRVFDAIPLMYVPRIKDLVAEIGDKLTADMDVRRMTTRDGSSVQVDVPVMFILEHIVAHMQAARCGGTLVFPAADGEQFIKSKYSTSAPGLGSALRDFYDASKRCEAVSSVDELRAGIAMWQSAITGILRSAEAIALMSRIDGCVVLGRSFEVLSFGSKLAPSKDLPGVPKTKAFSDTVDEPDDEVRRLGTRNQSAFDFCRTVPGSVAIVVSQDGQVRVAGSNARSVSFIESVAASSLQHPSW